MGVDKQYTIFVGGMEVNDYYALTWQEAVRVRDYYRKQGYDDAHIVEVYELEDK